MNHHFEHLNVKPFHIEGAYIFFPRPFRDERGSLTRIFCTAEFKALKFTVAQINISENWHRGTIRGLHYQPEQAKIVRCIEGALFDVIVDLRKTSPTYGKYASAWLSPGEAHAVYVPPGCAHGFQTMINHTTALYMLSQPWQAHLEQGVRWNDPKFAISWPEAPSLISERDRNFALLNWP